ncbi:MAG: S8 family peptidase [Planctomycetes bacterium]|nr:S8 family peptidase [Planctomycetota bacterium]
MDDNLYGDPVLLREVTEALDNSGGKPIPVIIGVRWENKIENIVEKLRDIGVKSKEIKCTDRYVSAKLSKKQVKEIAGAKSVFKIWHDRPIEPMCEQSAVTIKSTPAGQLFKADGDGVHWAVLDTGIKETHSYFSSPPSIVKNPSYNFTSETYTDRIGHGTHVAGIIRKLAPKTIIHDFKVLGKGGSTSFTIIQALYKIRKMNVDARKLLIHGVNMSLGGPVSVGSYGCGYSPECQEANMLVESGVVVCVAASNDGHKILATISSSNQLEYFPTFMNMGISDPGNAEKVITVGSCHKTIPHHYGISWFSSKGPTGDGRFKPDVVAPGERIMSASIKRGKREEEMSGTSMATPHVSAAIAQFLSVKEEFRGHPLEMKRILMENCTDLGRDRNFQGSGMIDVLRMMQAV